MNPAQNMTPSSHVDSQAPSSTASPNAENDLNVQLLHLELLIKDFRASINHHGNQGTVASNDIMEAYKRILQNPHASHSDIERTKICMVQVFTNIAAQAHAVRHAMDSHEMGELEVQFSRTDLDTETTGAVGDAIMNDSGENTAKTQEALSELQARFGM